MQDIMAFCEVPFLSMATTYILLGIYVEANGRSLLTFEVSVYVKDQS